MDGDGAGQEPDPFEVFTGDRESGRRLRENLARVADDHAGTPAGSVANAVLAGRRPIRDLAEDPDFSPLIAEGVDEYRRFLDALPPAERTGLADNARRAHSRSTWGARGTRRAQHRGPAEDA